MICVCGRGVCSSDLIDQKPAGRDALSLPLSCHPPTACSYTQDGLLHKTADWTLALAVPVHMHITTNALVTDYVPTRFRGTTALACACASSPHTHSNSHCVGVVCCMAAGSSDSSPVTQRAPDWTGILCMWLLRVCVCTQAQCGQLSWEHPW